jgi:hypothetical protein
MLSRLLQRLRRRKTFCLPDLTSPSRHQLAKHLKLRRFKPVTDPAKAWLSEKNLTLNPEATQYLEYKHLLAYLTQQHCPGVMPLTYIINDSNAGDILKRIRREHYSAVDPAVKPRDDIRKNAGISKNTVIPRLDRGIQESQTPHQYTDKKENLIWILKPSQLNNGQHIKLFTRFSELKAHYQNNQRLSGEHVLQQYIANPDLFNERKYTLRMFVTLHNNTTYHLYPHGYLNVGIEPYPDHPSYAHLNLHLTNEHLNEKAANIQQIPTQTLEHFEETRQKVGVIIQRVFDALFKEAPPLALDRQTPAFDFFGFDFILDTHNKLWLLEVNHGPCFPISENHPLQYGFYDGFWGEVVQRMELVALACNESLT